MRRRGELTTQGKRDVGKKRADPASYEISRNVFVNAPVETVFDSWLDENARRQWLEHSRFVIRKATPSKSMRITWVDGETNVHVNFYPKGREKCLVAVLHGKLPDASHAAHMKAYWGEQLERLKKVLEP